MTKMFNRFLATTVSFRKNECSVLGKCNLVTSANNMIIQKGQLIEKPK